VPPTYKRTPGGRWFVGGISLLCLVGTAFLLGRYRSESKLFDPPRFTPFTIIKKEVVSPTSIILTLRPQRGPKNESTTDIYKEWWEHGIWSVEVKQPELQISRSYTPLPPSKPHENGDLRFLIRKEHKGEVSGYLHRLTVGSKIELRGPHLGFDLPEDAAEVVFLAGGTGIAPALQVAHTFLERRNKSGNQARIRIVWSNRRREDCEGGRGQMDNMAWESGKQTGRIVQELETLQQRHPGRLTVDYYVDEENKFLDQRKLSRITRSSEKDTRIGSKLLFISGPEGFVNYFAGPKKWEGGKEGQGKVAGLLGQMKLKDWTIWKL
jgi:ferredoxin-NADP reductase